ncbi:MAG: hypothetical protein JWQ46_1791 [Phenylobacterium sp.]|jgi:hypothetical protein|nr:hypothetical protein [Phenylobacterium sp.]
MTDTRNNARPASRWMGLLGAALVASPGIAHAQALDLFYERTVMSVADERCRLFTPDVAAALAAATAQAKGAALRAGAAPDKVKAVERGARAKAAQADCASGDIAVAATRVRSAFAGFSRLTRLSYPGDVAGWRADRSDGRAARWRLMQQASFGADRMDFGLAGREGPGALMAIGRFGDGAVPYAAHLLLRDGSRSAGPYLDRWNGGATAGLPLSRRLPPRSAVKIYAAEARSPAGQDLSPKDAGPGWAFRFPADAAHELAGLDPREAVAVEFLFPGDVARRAYVEVGDFAAGRAFLTLAER